VTDSNRIGGFTQMSEVIRRRHSERTPSILTTTLPKATLRPSSRRPVGHHGAQHAELRDHRRR